MARLFAIAAALPVIGCASSLASTRQCEFAAASTVGRALGTRRVFVLTDDSRSSRETYEGSEAILQRAGFDVRPCQASAGEFDCFPWAGVGQARVVGPFLVDVSWGYVAAPLGGSGNRTRYLAFFGIVVPLRDMGGWAA